MMKNYTAVSGSSDAGENGIYTMGYDAMVLSSRELDKLGVSLSRVVYADWSDTAIEDLVAQNEKRMAKNKAVWEARQRELGR